MIQCRTGSARLSVLRGGRHAKVAAGFRFVPSGRLFHGQPEFGNHLLAHDKLLDLAGDGHRKAVNKSDIARDLIMRDLTAAEVADFLSGRILAVAQPYPGAEFLAIVPVGHADHLHVLDLRMPVQKFLDLAGIDVLSTRLPELLRALATTHVTRLR